MSCMLFCPLLGHIATFAHESPLVVYAPLLLQTALFTAPARGMALAHALLLLLLDFLHLPTSHRCYLYAPMRSLLCVLQVLHMLYMFYLLYTCIGVGALGW